jgi:circadian clock protein KaiC
MTKTQRSRPAPAGLDKAATGVAGFDEITNGGLPRGRPTLVCGSAGSGKTFLGMEFLVRGATQFGEPGMFMAFEETAPDLATNFASIGFDLNHLEDQKKLVLDYVHIERSEIEETGEYDLEGLFIRLGHAIDSIGAKRVVLDTIEAIFSGFGNTNILRAELRRLFRWLKEKGVTAIVTGERGGEHLTRHGLEEYVSDCVIVLDHRIVEQIATRRMRILKYRGSAHGTSEYPFLIGEKGFSVLPISSLGLTHPASTQRVSTGIAPLDAMLTGGYYRGSTVLVSGSAGTGKTSLAATFLDAACRRGEKAVFFLFEESPAQVMRNMRSIGIDLAPHEKKGLLRFQAVRGTRYGLELHLATIHKAIEEFGPEVVALDPITNLQANASNIEVRAMLSRLIDFLKGKGITALCNSLHHRGAADRAVETSEVEVSSLMDTWLLLRNLEAGGERNRALYVLKSRGMAHSNQVREFVLGDRGIDLVDVYTGAGEVLAGSARLNQAAREREAATRSQQDAELKERQLERKRQIMEAQIAAIRAQFESEEDELHRASEQQSQLGAQLADDRAAMAVSRGADGLNRFDGAPVRK